jgi:hypothetical protein
MQMDFELNVPKAHHHGFEEVERLIQYTQKEACKVRTEDLRVVRARLADTYESADLNDKQRESILIRGSIVHREISERQSNPKPLRDAWRAFADGTFGSRASALRRLCWTNTNARL